MPADIARLEQANLRSANRALARDDVATLVALGFSHQHIGELKQNGGFRSSSHARGWQILDHWAFNCPGQLRRLEAMARYFCWDGCWSSKASNIRW